jgi:hypothetical protein
MFSRHQRLVIDSTTSQIDGREMVDLVCHVAVTGLSNNWGPGHF